jgi:hypothetical protein
MTTFFLWRLIVHIRWLLVVDIDIDIDIDVVTYSGECGTVASCWSDMTKSNEY